MHTLKSSVATCDVHQFPQTAGDRIHSLLEEAVCDIGDNVPNPCFQFFQCATFCTVHLILCPAPQEKVTGCEIWTSCSPFVKSASSRPTLRKLLIQPRTFGICKVSWCTIVLENKEVSVYPARYRGPYAILKRLKEAFGIHGITQKTWPDDTCGRHSPSHGQF
jgi:hypothetical protein